jgi:tetratricopeptide (TPR) repeat protein
VDRDQSRQPGAARVRADEGWRGARPYLAVFIGAFAIRILYLLEIGDMPFYQIPIVDARAYDEWAQRIVAEGGWGSEVFYQAPAYPYWLALIYRLFGRNLDLVHAIQMAMGGLSCVFLMAATRAMFGFATGRLAGWMLAVYPPAIFFDGLIGKQCLDIFLLTGMLALLAGHQRSPDWRRAAGAGGMLGLLALTRENALIFLPAIPVWMLWRHRGRSTPAQVREIGAYLVCAFLILLAVGTRNFLVGDTFALTTSQMGPNFYMGNHEHATGLYVPLVPGRHTPVYEAPDAERIAERALGRPLTRGEVSDYWMERGLEFVRTQPGRFAALLARKLLLTWHRAEIADVEDIHVYADWSRILRYGLPLWNFGLLVPLTAAGIVLAWPRRRDLVLLVGAMAAYSLSVALFITFARFRYPLVVFMLPLAAHALVLAREMWVSGERSRLGPALVTFALVGLLVRAPVIDEDRLLMSGYANLGGVLLNEGRTAEAEPHLLRAMELDPDNADLRFSMAVLAREQGHPEAALDHLRVMVELAPEDSRGPRLMALVLREAGRDAEAREQTRRARRLDPDR